MKKEYQILFTMPFEATTLKMLLLIWKMHVWMYRYNFTIETNVFFAYWILLRGRCHQLREIQLCTTTYICNSVRIIMHKLNNLRPKCMKPVISSKHSITC